jgi:hypothetical protein
MKGIFRCRDEYCPGREDEVILASEHEAMLKGPQAWGIATELNQLGLCIMQRDHTVRIIEPADLARIREILGPAD